MGQVLVRVEPTSDPNAVKFTLNCSVVSSGALTYHNPHEAGDSPLAKAIFAAGPIENITMIANSITVVKKIASNWGDMIPRVEKAILENMR